MHHIGLGERVMYLCSFGPGSFGNPSRCIVKAPVVQRCARKSPWIHTTLRGLADCRGWAVPEYELTADEVIGMTP